MASTNQNHQVITFNVQLGKLMESAVNAFCEEAFDGLEDEFEVNGESETISEAESLQQPYGQAQSGIKRKRSGILGDSDSDSDKGSLVAIPSSSMAEPSHACGVRGGNSRGGEVKESTKTGSSIRQVNKRNKAKVGQPYEKQHGKSFVRPHQAIVLSITVDANFNVTKGGYSTKLLRKDDSNAFSNRLFTVDELEKVHGFQVEKWDGQCNLIITDEEEKCIVTFLAMPKQAEGGRGSQASFGDCCKRVAQEFNTLRDQFPRAFTPKSCSHRRGNYHALSVGMSYNNGQRYAKNYDLSGPQEQIANRLLPNPNLIRIAGFQSDALASYFPLSYLHLCRQMKALHESDERLRFNFPNSIYPTCTFNMGPKTACVEHLDSTNYPSVPCAVTAFGDFDYEKGGHFVLHDLNLCVQFPPGSTVLLSSAGLRHGNTALNRGDTRYSFTQYCIGNLIKWVAYGFKPVKSIPDKDREALDWKNSEGWEVQQRRFSNFWDLDDHREALRKAEPELRQNK